MNNPNITISEILAQKGSQAWCISPEATVFEAIQLMAEKNIGALLVTENEKLIGILSERDYTRKVALKGKTSKQVAVREINQAAVRIARRERHENHICTVVHVSISSAGELPAGAKHFNERAAPAGDALRHGRAVVRRARSG